MELFGAAAAAGAVGTGKELWDYNRENYLYDRSMRNKVEFKILDIKRAQAEMWREDVRDITELTVRKMDNYIIINALLLGMCLALYAEGKLSPSTPPWLLHFYMLTLGAAFMYLLLSVWLAMHASIIAQCSSVRILTQFVRIPIPTWEDLEEARTYGTSFETVKPSRMFRVPFIGHHAAQDGGAFEQKTPAPKESRGGPPRQQWKREWDVNGRPVDPKASGRSSGSAAPATIDPWGLERHGDQRDLYELQAMPAALRRHIGLARRAAMQYQCFDAFARVCMTFGINQFLHAIIYYFLGYTAYQSGSPTPAWCASATMLCMSLTLVRLDFSLTGAQQKLVAFLVCGGPVCTATALMLWAYQKEGTEVKLLVCVAYFIHGVWLLYGMDLCSIEVQANGATLPMKFRAVLYLDVFGWLGKTGFAGLDVMDRGDQDPFVRQVSEELGARQYPHDVLNDHESLESVPMVRPTKKTLTRKKSACGELVAPENAFHASTYAPTSSQAHHSDKQQGQSLMDQPGVFPARIFTILTKLLTVLWVFGSAIPFAGFWMHMKSPISHEGAEPGEHIEHGEHHAHAAAFTLGGLSPRRTRSRSGQQAAAAVVEHGAAGACYESSSLPLAVAACGAVFASAPRRRSRRADA